MVIKGIRYYQREDRLSHQIITSGLSFFQQMPYYCKRNLRVSSKEHRKEGHAKIMQISNNIQCMNFNGSKLMMSYVDEGCLVFVPILYRTLHCA